MNENGWEWMKWMRMNFNNENEWLKMNENEFKWKKMNLNEWEWI